MSKAKKSFARNMALARARVAELDRSDGDSAERRWASYPKDTRCELAVTLNTLWCALDAGLRHPGTDGAEYDALVMLEDLTGRTKLRSERN